MFNVSEATTLMARHRQVCSVATMVAALAVGGALSTAQGQAPAQRGVPAPNTPRLVVVNFRSADKESGLAAANAVRDRLMREYSARETWVIPKKENDNFLQSSGYPTDEALTSSDAHALARQMRADHFVEGTVTPAAGQFRVDSRVVVARGNTPGLFVQPLPSQTVAKPSDAAAAIARDVKEVRKHLEAEQECYNNAAQQKYAEARAAAARGLQQYPRSSIVRLCLAQIMVAQKAPADSMLTVVNELLAIDPRSRPALGLKYTALTELKREEEAQNVLTQMLAADPSNVDLQNRVVNELARSGKFDTAAAIITQALQENEGDPQLMRTAFLVYQAAQRWPQAIQVGEQLNAMNDTTLDRNYYLRLANAYVQTKQPQKAAEAISRGTQRFPQDAELLTGAAGVYREAGQLQQAVEVLRRGLQLNPRAPQANLVMAQIYADMNQPDSALASLRAAQTAGDSTRLVAGLAAQLGNAALQAGQANKSRADYERAVKFLSFAEPLNSTPEIQFALGAAAFQAGYLGVTEAQSSNNCELARGAQANFAIANRYVPQAGKVSPESAGQIMGALGQLQAPTAALIRSLCR
jgi:tetratricopeptide (TPR) repeat protein